MGAAGVVGHLLPGRGEGAVEGQGAVRRRGGDGVGHSVFRDVAHGLCVGKGSIMTHSCNHNNSRRKESHSGVNNFPCLQCFLWWS